MIVRQMLARSQTVVRLTLPWPDSILNPNNRSHWRAKLEAKRSARESAYCLAYNLHTALDGQKKYQVELIFCPPDKRPRDLDNMLSSQKHALDGMCKALKINDRMIRPVLDWGPVVRGGRVEVRISEAVVQLS